jgi:type IV pilus assembly protein PilO
MAKGFNDLPGAVQAVILAGAAAILAGVVFYLYVLPLSAQRTKLEAEVNRLHQENLKNQAVERERPELLNRIAQLEKQLDTLRSIVPDEQATDQFVRMVHDTSVGAGIHLRNFTAGALVQRDFYVETPFNVRLDGVYYQLLAFFDRLAREQRIVSVTNLSLGPPAGGGQGNFKILPSETVGASCMITTYYNKPQAPAAQAQPKKK